MQSYIFKIYRNSIPFLLLLVFMTSGCKDFTESDIVDSKVFLESPVDKYKSTNSNLIFKWNEVEGADEYLFEIASGSFGTGAIIYDSLATENSIELSFFSGQYQWRVKALNNSSSTDYSEVYDFVIETIIDLTDQSVAVIEPIGLFNKVNHTFRWQNINGATSYTVIVREISWETGVTLATIVTSDDSASIVGLEEGAFVWGVRAENLTPSVTEYTKIFMEIDTTRPDPSEITSTTMDTISLGSSKTIKWAHANSVGVYSTDVQDSVYVYSDSLITVHSAIGTGALTYVVDDIISVGKYFYRIKTHDEAGNVSKFSDPNYFVVE